MGGEVFTVNRRERSSPEAGYSEFLADGRNLHKG
jgi:hypothetical protein